MSEADKMFEKLGYTKTEDYYEGNIYEIKYIKKGKYSTNITINVKGKMVKAYCEENGAGWCDIKILKAIIKKVEELARKEVDK